MVYGDLKDSSSRIASILRNKAFNIAKNSNYDGYQRGLASMVYTVFWIKKTSVSDIKNENMSRITKNH